VPAILIWLQIVGLTLRRRGRSSDRRVCGCTDDGVRNLGRVEPFCEGVTGAGLRGKLNLCFSKDGDAEFSGAQDPVTRSGDTSANSIAATPAMARGFRPKKAPSTFDKTINIPLRPNNCDYSKSWAGAAADGPRVTAHFEKLEPPAANAVVSAMRRVHCPVCVGPPSA
jgi:hypothetical protein